jgi:hypothetical protein
MENNGIELIYLNLNLKLQSKNIEKNIISSKPLKDTKNFKKKYLRKDTSLWIYKFFMVYIKDNFFECPLIIRKMGTI